MRLICVLGAGPAGCAAAHVLSTLGHTCMLLNRAGPKRTAESISPGARHFLRLMNADLPRVTHTPLSLKWGGELIERVSESELVDRFTFDSGLIEAAVGAGSQYVEVSSINMPFKMENGWRVNAVVGGESCSWQADYLVIATGRIPLLPTRRARLLPPLLALSGKWIIENNSDQMIVEALPNGWLWGARSGTGEFTVTTFVDAASARELQDLYLEMVGGSTLLPDLTALHSFEACDASAQYSLEPVGKECIYVGESALCLEPLSSQGVQMALKLGFQGGLAAHNIMRGGEDARRAKRFYENQIRRSAARHQRGAQHFYSMSEGYYATEFWKKRSLDPVSPAGEVTNDVYLVGATLSSRF